MITEVRIAGAVIDPCFVILEAISVRHGRDTVDAKASPSSATLSLLVPATVGMPTWAVADTLEVVSSWGPMFTGLISDRRLNGHRQDPKLGPYARFEITGAGNLALLGRRTVGLQAWPLETATARAERVLTLASVPHLVNSPPTGELSVIARPLGKETALNVMEELASDTGSALIDLPDGKVWYQPLKSRSRPQFYYRWMDFPPADTWADFDAATTWADLALLSPASEVPVQLPSCAVGYEPEWVSSAAAIVNHVTIGYGVAVEGSEQASVVMQDSASITRYGKLEASEGTQLATASDAQNIATWVIATRAWERWSLASVDVYVNHLTSDEAVSVAGLRCGDWVGISDLPQPAPAASWAAIVEGWTYNESVNDGLRWAAFTLALSDPIASLAVPTWADHTPSHEWQDYNPLNTWADLTDLTSIGA